MNSILQNINNICLTCLLIEVPPLLYSYRLLVAILICWGIANNQIMRGNISMAIVCMVNSSAVDETSPGESNNGSNSSSQCTLSSDDAQHYNGEFMWNKNQVANIFSAVYIGLIPLTIPVGIIADRMGAKWPMLVSVLLSSVFTLLTPLAANAGYGYMIALRLLLGLAQAAAWPCMNVLTTKWAPKTEKSAFVAITTAGNQISFIIAMPMSAELCAHGFAGGWPSVFYVSGILGITWCILWLIFASDYPDSNHWISQRERQYINASAGRSNVKKKFTELPFRKMLSCAAVWAMLTSYCAYSFVINTMKMYLPQYWKEVMLFDISSNGIYSALPYIVQTIFKYISSIFVDVLREKLGIRGSILSRLFNSICLFGLGGFLIATTFVDCERKNLAVAFVAVAFGLAGAGGPGFLTSMVTIAPLYSGAISAMGNTLAMIVTAVSPYIVAAVVMHGTQSEWQIVFFFASASVIIAGIFYIFSGSVDEQPWAKITGDTAEKALQPQYLAKGMKREENNDEMNEIIVKRF